MKIVVTGSESFIGKELKRHCRAKGIECVGIDAVPSEDAGHHLMDIRSPDIAGVIPEGADALVHLAALSRTQDCQANPGKAFDVNVGGTWNLIRAAGRRNIRQFLFASSEWVYGEGSEDRTQREEDSIAPDRVPSEYALTKLFGEYALNLAYRNGFCPVTVLRFGITYGLRPNNWSAVESLFNAVRTQEEVVVKGSLATGRRFIHVSDIARGLLAALGQTGYQVFNLTGDRLIRLSDILRESMALLNRHPRIIEQNPAAVSIHNPDNAKARRELHWKPMIDLQAGLKSLLPQEEAREPLCQRS
ncbi:MAG: NAD(P)-dependent oxidoreductase [Candidatus Omnitrophica bacterium]|nr:NAD(P)-dependent oxidoreductase [Candidatus Omnitrophota bacterium]